MHHVALLAKSVAAGVVAGISTFPCTFAAASVVDERTPVPLGAAFAVGLFVCGVVWWVGQKVQKLTDNLESMTTDLKSARDDSKSAREIAAQALVIAAAKAKVEVEHDAVTAKAIVEADAQRRLEG